MKIKNRSNTFEQARREPALKKRHAGGGKIYSCPRKRKDEIKKARMKTEGDLEVAAKGTDQTCHPKRPFGSLVFMSILHVNHW